MKRLFNAKAILLSAIEYSGYSRPYYLLKMQSKKLIQIVIDDEIMKDNILKSEFLKKISELDIRMEKFIRADRNLDWKKDFKPDYIDWSLTGE